MLTNHPKIHKASPKYMNNVWVLCVCVCQTRRQRSSANIINIIINSINVALALLLEYLVPGLNKVLFDAIDSKR